MELLHPEPRPRTTDRVGFEPTVPLRAHRFSRPAVSTTHAPVRTTRRLDAQTPRPCAPLGVQASRRLCYSADRVGFEPTKRLPVYALSRRVPSAARPPIRTTRRTDAND